MIGKNLLLEVPRQHVVNVRRLFHFLLQDDGNVHAGREEATAKLVLLHQELNVVSPDPEVVEKCVPLDRSPHPVDPFAGLPGPVQVRQVLRFHALDPLGKIGIGRKSVRVRGVFLFPKSREPL